MLGCTHLVVGAAGAALISQPKTVPEFILFASIGAVGGLIPDIDSEHSTITYVFQKGIIISIIILVIFSKLSTEEVTNLKDSFKKFEIAHGYAFIAFIGLLIFGRSAKHRDVTHSIEYAFLVACSGYFFNVYIGIPLFVGLMSHILLDLLNYKGITISVFLRKKIAFNVCRSDGAVNWIICFAGAA